MGTRRIESIEEKVGEWEVEFTALKEKFASVDEKLDGVEELKTQMLGLQEMIKQMVAGQHNMGGSVNPNPNPNPIAPPVDGEGGSRVREGPNAKGKEAIDIVDHGGDAWSAGPRGGRYGPNWGGEDYSTAGFMGDARASYTQNHPEQFFQGREGGSMPYNQWGGGSYQEENENNDGEREERRNQNKDKTKGRKSKPRALDSSEEYVDEAAMIPKNTSVLIRRPDESEWYEFGNDLYSVPEVHPAQSNAPIVDVSPTNKVDEESKIKALLDTPALDWNRQGHDSYGAGRGFGRGMGGRMMAGRGFARGMMEKKTPPAGYICHRCKVPGHFIQHCPTNGDPSYEIKRVKPPTGIPRSMLMATPDGSYALPSGAVAVLKPNEAAFEKEIEGLPSTRSISDLPPELHCPLCNEVMKDAVLTGRCCFKSFCDKCIRDYIINNSKCVCGATNILADDLLPNKTLRETISRILETTTSSTENAGSLAQVQDMESARPVQSRVPSATLSRTSKGEPKQPLPADNTAYIKEGEGASEPKTDNFTSVFPDKKSEKTMDQAEATPIPEEAQEKLPPGDLGKKKKKKKTRIATTGSDMQWRNFQQDFGLDNFAGMPVGPSKSEKTMDQAEATHDFTNVKEAVYAEATPITEEAQEKLPPGDLVKKKKKKTRIAATGSDMQWRNFQQDFGLDNFAGMAVGLSAYNPYWGLGMPIGIDGFIPSLAAPMPYMVYTPTSPFDVPFGGILPPDPYIAQGYMMPGFPLRFLLFRSFLLIREFSRERENVTPGKETNSSVDAVSLKKAKPQLRSEVLEIIKKQQPNVDRSAGPSRDAVRHSPPPPRPPPLKRKSSDWEQSDGDASATSKAERKQKGSVFSRISFPAECGDPDRGTGKRRKTSSDPPDGLKDHSERERERLLVNGYISSSTGRRSGGGAGGYDYESSDEERHFKRRSSSSRRKSEEEEAARAPRVLRERE
ncbi:E3 ubiquitin-protein ligase COP1 [Dendrobium catenatum]|uniref:E3 ubiquitin-protein ligase COP1 n=1 Tax=Dendrobium catenatum TaxID=906689 RepID=A0A2I0X4V3_9ASPA|nr:E3 ubiquitin-protein ligase COP1 [Dendrobium catenatum]